MPPRRTTDLPGGGRRRALQSGAGSAARRLWPDRVGYGDVRLVVVNCVSAGWWSPVWVLWTLMAGARAHGPQLQRPWFGPPSEAAVRWVPGLVAGGAASVVAYRLWAEGPAT